MSINLFQEISVLAAAAGEIGIIGKHPTGKLVSVGCGYPIDFGNVLPSNYES